MTTTGKPVEKTATVITARDLELLGGGEVAYIRTLTSEEATQFYPDVEDLPPGLELFALHAADGSPIALTDSFDAAVGHAIDGDLSIASVH